ncbi:MAG TPA: CD225/dispanin family protein [Pirellulales bacterium]|jgi:hypothetical protein|nr:CD225/dispanin family protein [Pirellulales bacterium]
MPGLRRAAEKSVSIEHGDRRADLSRPQLPNYLVPAILSTICCCLPFGIVAIVYAAKVNGKLAAGDYEGARRSSDSAKM